MYTHFDDAKILEGQPVSEVGAATRLSLDCTIERLHIIRMRDKSAAPKRANDAPFYGLWWRYTTPTRSVF